MRDTILYPAFNHTEKGFGGNLWNTVLTCIKYINEGLRHKGVSVTQEPTLPVAPISKRKSLKPLYSRFTNRLRHLRFGMLVVLGVV